MAAQPEARHSQIRFLLGGKLVSVDAAEPTRTVLGHLRETLGRPGTKEGCAEGDCGACTVVVAALSDGQVKLKPVNSCIQLLPTLDARPCSPSRTCAGRMAACTRCKQQWWIVMVRNAVFARRVS